MSDFETGAAADELRMLWKPRTRHDPNGLVAKRMTGRKSVAAATARLARVVAKTPEVMVKVTGRPKGVRHLSAHLDYISRKGELTLENRDGLDLDEKEGREDLARHWGDKGYGSNNARVAAVSMVFSMPEGTDANKVLDAVREIAETEISEEWDYVMALHKDQSHPHVHLTVAGRGDTGRRFNPRPHDLHRYRERFSEALRARGIEAEATPRSARGISRSGQSMALYKMRGRYRAGAALAPIVNSRITDAAKADYLGEASPPSFVRNAERTWRHAQSVYLRAAEELKRSSDPRERKLALAVEAFARRQRQKSVHERSVEMIRDKFVGKGRFGDERQLDRSRERGK